ncbi:MAG: VanZ family protein [Gammaproteobacteria bacterium]|nr:VanZ family protein [Gammaproteobacteria bacterium]MDH3858682.1 VanZ family protein [Gammaproteobacteria bacterium]
MTQTSDNPRSPLRLAAAWYVIGAIMLLGVAVASLVPVPDIGVSDKLSHLVTYFLLAGWFSLLAANRITLGWTVIGLIAYGMLIELLQGMTSYRYPEWGDVLANGIGVLAGILLYFSPLSRLLRFVDSRLARLWLQ